MIKLKIKTGDIVRVIAGDHKGEEGKVRVDREKNKAIVEGVNMVSKHTRTKCKKSPQGGIVKKLLYSNI
jgi:large subunit ribosomal protein L24